MLTKIIFDLDGTLWKTEDSYIYAYRKLEEEYGLKHLAKEDILEVCGRPLEEVQERIFNGYQNKEELTKKAVLYSTEFVRQVPSFCSKDISQLFKKIKEKKLEIYIISGCPRIYLDAFLDTSGVRSFVTDSFSLEAGTKNAVLNMLTKKKKALFVGDAKEDYEAIEDHKSCFFCYAAYGYFSLDTYDYHLHSLDEILTLIDKIEIKERKLIRDTYEIISSHNTNITLIQKSNGYNYFGFLEIEKMDDLKKVLNKLKEKKVSLYGPFDGNTWYSYRMPLNSFDLRLYPDCFGSQEILDCFIEAGFVISHTYSSTLAPINEKVWNRCKQATQNQFQVKILTGADCYAHIDALYNIANVAFQKADFFEPIQLKEFKEIYIKNLSLVAPDLVLIYKNEQPIAFNFCYEDIEKRFYVCKTIAILPEYQNKTILKILIDVSYQLMVQRGYQEVLYHFQNDRTKVLRGIYKDKFLWQKKYGVLKYENK